MLHVSETALTTLLKHLAKHSVPKAVRVYLAGG